MKKLFSKLLITSLVIFTSCADEQLRFENETFQQKSKLPCEETCTNISIDVDVANGNFVADSINTAVFESVKRIVYFGEIPLDASEYSDLTNSFIKAYDDFKTEFPDDFMMPWEANVQSKLQYQSAQVIQIRIDHDTFTGGAHGMFASTVLSFDASTGNQLKTDDFFKDIDRLKKMAAEKFKTKFKIANDQSLQDAGYFFQNEDFVLPENVFFSKEGITFHYNVYEIASYAQGAIMLDFTEDEMKPFLKIH